MLLSAVSEQPAANGAVGMLTLNVPKTLNSLTLEMVDLLQGALDRWRDDDAIALVVIDAEGFLRCLPHRHDMDGFFAARMERVQ